MSSIIIQAKVRKLLTDFDVSRAPVPVEQIAQQLGIQVSYAPSTEYSGMLIRTESGEVLMGVSSDESPTRRRFTIAHELGHFHLEKNKVSIDYRGNYHGSDKPASEKNADDFAANLLMPRSFLSKDFHRISGGKLFLEDQLVALAELYQVSREAMMWRLKNLNLTP
ncbi:MAG: hypothetical protein COU29_02785 [Candidatus Magasanikbacteria bacterium CG10_big_fil_rev_8_21_14_0_10_36_32]|uniref:IrrE N-terminal-like domain-containing protein n=1 Tax=Candidatus Magasanikbacteria bacterium CG10_big_fil_rev_8_21_14_0_10_36_32 TaxID=1974646 RepID=A0A2M6W778_9BACT|nr:MAG: hypothetical protein COU29_02785 [Candidatus Magasanikbacteria bacterium CG10_big_fil_rev_8_21_14_0_10_36_32]